MASLEPPNSPSNNPSFTIRVATKHNKFMRSSSSKESSFQEPPCTPPRFSSATISSPFNISQPSTPRLSFTLSTSKLDESQVTYKCISSVLKKDGQILCIAVSTGIVYTGSQTNVIRIWKLPEFTECGQLKTKTSMVVALIVSNDKVYAAYSDCKIRVWQRSWDGAIKHVRVATIPKPGNYVRSYIGGKDKMKHMGPISSLAVNVTDDILYSSSLDKTVKVWRISDFKCIETIHAHQEPVNAITVADDGVLFTASDDATVRVWRRNFSGGDRPHSLTVTLPAKYSPVKTLALTADGSVLYGGCSDGYIHYWLKGWFSGQLQYGGALQGHTHAVMCLAMVSNYVVSGSADSTSRVWIREEGGLHICVAVLQGHRGPIRCISAFLSRVTGDSDDGCIVCSGSLDGVIKMWKVTCTNNTPQESSQTGCEYFDLT
ncbi:hypothetical protein LIER_24559 [Lithospermum erythrorhizon]|uniref:Uncharacterized protein n=1 Tax=Lithospermum erythrorhizon TaxID=34254 RepID=A0AAV3R2N8_LITER